MANKYIIHGATYCGDGTASNEAASAGAVGAWNDINVFEGSAPAYGALAAGDVVAIRSKTSAGANITRTLAANATIGSSAGTAAAPVTWVLDGGTVWPGVSGTLTYSCGGGYVVIMRPYNRFFADVADSLVILENNAAASYKSYQLLSNGIHTKNLLVDFSLLCSSDGSFVVENTAATGGVCHHENLHIKSNKRYYGLFQGLSYSGTCLFTNPDIELLNASNTHSVFYSNDDARRYEVYGGQIRGAGAVAGVPVFNINGKSEAHIRTVGFQFPRGMTPFTGNNLGSQSQSISCVGSDGAAGAFVKEPWGFADSRDDNNYPKLNAALPDTSGTLWSWKICPLTTSVSIPVRLPLMKYYTEAAATKTIELEIQVSTTLTNVAANTVWMTVEYVDHSTGLSKHCTTFEVAGGALAASTAGWTLSTYGATSLTKRKLSVTTPTQIKQDTPITVTFFTTTKAASESDLLNDILFIDPDFVVTA